jgi:hypothetical protein
MGAVGKSCKEIDLIISKEQLQHPEQLKRGDKRGTLGKVRNGE